jgi:hypothetical protein
VTDEAVLRHFGNRILTFFTEVFVVRTALAILLTLRVTVTLPPSCKGLKAAAFTGKLYPEQNKHELLVIKGLIIISHLTAD